MVMMTLYLRYGKRHRYKEQTFDSVGGGEGGMIWENSIDMCITLCEIDDQSKYNAWNRALKASALGQPKGMGWGGRWEGGLVQGDTCTPVADSRQCMAKTTKIL